LANSCLPSCRQCGSGSPTPTRFEGRTLTAAQTPSWARAATPQRERGGIRLLWSSSCSGRLPPARVARRVFRGASGAPSSPNRPHLRSGKPRLTVLRRCAGRGAGFGAVGHQRSCRHDGERTGNRDKALVHASLLGSRQLSRRLGVSSRVFRARLRKKCSGLPWSARIKSVCFPSTICAPQKAALLAAATRRAGFFTPICREV
jgi:hypothetical protein